MRLFRKKNSTTVPNEIEDIGVFDEVSPEIKAQIITQVVGVVNCARNAIYAFPVEYHDRAEKVGKRAFKKIVSASTSILAGLATGATDADTSKVAAVWQDIIQQSQFLTELLAAIRDAVKSKSLAESSKDNANG